MPQKKIDYTMAYDFAAWRARIGGIKPISMKEAAITVGISYATWNRAEQTGQAQKQLVWACYGVEQAMRLKREADAVAAQAVVSITNTDEGDE